MICRRCKEKMYLDDKDFNFKGNYDDYWVCDNCNSSCVETVRYNKTTKEYWCHHDEEEKRYIIHRDLIEAGILTEADCCG